MAFGLPTDQRSQIMLVLILAAGAGAYFSWTYSHQPKTQQIATYQAEIDSLQRIIESVKRDLASGTMEDLRRTVDHYRANLQVMRRLVPESNEVPKLMDDITTRAKVRGVNLGKFDPRPPEPGHPFDTYRYGLQIFGHYDQVGEFLTDVASLPRIIVPQDVVMQPAQATVQKLLGDTLGGLVEVNLMLRTYVKSSAPPPPAARPGTAARPGAPGGGRP